MTRVEVVVDRAFDKARNVRFVEWLEGWLRTHCDVVDACFWCNELRVDADMFDLFANMYRVVQYMRWVLKADVLVVVCGNDGCIDMSEVDDLLFLIPKDEIEKLENVEKKVKEMISSSVKGIGMMGEGGRAWFNVGGCETYIYDDEAVAFSGLLLDKLYQKTKQEVFMEMRDTVYEVFRPEKFNLDVYISSWDDKIFVEVNGCPMLLSHEEVLYVVYGLLSISTMNFRESWIIAEEDWGYR
jgi:hypothetical protein